PWAYDREDVDYGGYVLVVHGNCDVKACTFVDNGNNSIQQLVTTGNITGIWL
ncbi:hypothetical protein BGZ49_001296, partial [Haplosporangium sp. Z 27]